MHKATELIVNTFDEQSFKYRVEELGELSVVEAGFEVEAGPEVIVRYISDDEGNDVAVRVFGLIRRIPDAKRAAALEACNTLSAKVRFFKFYLDKDGNINVEADLPVNVADESVGECCVELFVRLMAILENEYHIFVEALYACAAPEEPRANKLVELLDSLRERPFPVDEVETA